MEPGEGAAGAGGTVGAPAGAPAGGFTSLNNSVGKIPRPSDALRRAKASARSAKQSALSAKMRMKALKKKNSSSNMLRRKRNSIGPVQPLPGGVVMAGLLYKRRSGMTGLAASLFHQSESRTERRFGGRLWSMRYMVLRGGVMSYYDVPKSALEPPGEDLGVERHLSNGDIDLGDNPEADLGAERGSIDLSRLGVQIRFSFGHSSQMTNLLNGIPSSDKSTRHLRTDHAADDSAHPPGGAHANAHAGGGAAAVAAPGPAAATEDVRGTEQAEIGIDTRSPTPFLIEIVYNNMLNPKDWQSWTLCASDRATLSRWVSALLSVVYAPRGVGGHLLPPEEGSDEELEEFELGDPHKRRSSNLSSAGAETLQSPSSGPGLDSASGAGDLDAGLDEVDGDSLSSCGPPAGGALPQSAPLRLLYQHGLELAAALCLTNLYLLPSGVVREWVVIATLTLANLLVIWHVQGRGETSPAVPIPALSLPLRSPIVRSPSEADGAVGGPLGLRKLGSPALGRKPMERQGSASVPASSPSRGDGLGQVPLLSPKPIPQVRDGGQTVPYVAPEQAAGQRHCWTEADHSLLKVRIGPDYKYNKRKAPTKTSFFRTIGIDLFESEGKIMEVVHKVNPPWDKCVEVDAALAPFPRLLIINFQLPRPGGSSFSSGDGPGYNFVVYYTPTEELLRAARDREAGRFAEPAVTLLKRWFLESGENQAVKERLKLVGFVLNPNECGMPGWTQSFNGKPVLIKKSAVIARDEEQRYCEIDIDLRQWGFMTRKGISALLPSALKKMEFIVSLVIQGEDDDELPERSMVATQVNYLDTRAAVPYS